MVKHRQKYTTFAMQDYARTHQLYRYALNIIEAIVEFMEWVEKRLQGVMALVKKIC
jgi:hypothetical protein